MAASCVQRDDWCTTVGDRTVRTYQFLTDGDPWPLQGAVVTSQVRAKASDPDPAVLDAVCESVDEAAGIFTVEYATESARDLMVGDKPWVGVFDIQVLEPGETLPETIVGGSFTLLPDVTRDPAVA